MFGELKSSIKRRIIVRRTVRTNISPVKKGIKLPKWFCIKMDTGESHSNVAFTVRHTVTKLSINHSVWRGRGAGAESNRGPACQPNACACVYVCVCVRACICVFVQATVIARVFVFQCVSVSLCFVWLSMFSNAILCYIMLLIFVLVFMHPMLFVN